MFLHLSQSLQSPKGLTISSRFVCLSTVYKSLQLYDEAIIATSLALTFDAIEVSETTPNINFRDPLANLVVSLVNCSKDVIVMATKHDDRAISELRMGLARSLVQMLAERKRSIYRPRRLHKSELVSLAPGQAIELLMNAVSVDADIVDLFEERCGVEFCLGGICETFFGISFARPQQQSKPFALLVEHTKTIIGIMVKLANVFRQGGNTLPEETTVSFADYHLCCQMAETNILEICSEDKSASEVLICLLFVVASVSLLFHPIFNYKSGNVGAHGHLIEKYALAAQIAIKMSTHTNQWKLLTSAVSLAVDFYAAQISNADQQAYKCYREKLIPIMRVVESLNTADEKSQVFVSIITRGLVTLLSRLCCVSAQDGEVLHAAQFSIWNLDVAKMDGADQHSWFEATSLSRMVPDFVAPIRLVHQDSLPSLQPASLELRACRLRLMLLDTENFCNVDLIQSNFISSLADVDSMNQSNENELLLRWTRSTILLGLSECAEKSANFELALRFSKQCFEECKTVTTFLKTLRGSLFSSQDQFWIKVAVSSLPILCIERQVQCLERLAHHHSRLHDHRKAIEYALLAANPATIEILGPLTQLSFAEILDILRANPSESCQDTRTRRLILRLKTQSYPLDKVLTAFKGRVVPHSLSSIGDVQKSCSATHDLEAIKDLFESTFHMSCKTLSSYF